MLLKDFYEIKNKQNFDSKENFSLTVEFNPQHDIFKGHFPGNPVVPGVCLMQIIKEILEFKFDTNLNLVKGNNIKFQSMVSPVQNKTIVLSFDILEHSELLKIKCKAHSETVTFFTFAGSFSISV